MEIVTLMTDAVGDISSAVLDVIGGISSLIGIAVPLLAVLLASLAGRISGIERFFVFASLRRAQTLLIRSEGRSRRAEIRRLTAVIRNHVVLQLADVPVSVSETIAANVLRDVSRSDSLPELRVLQQLAATAAAPGRQSAIARLAWPDSLTRARDAYSEFSAFVKRTYLDKAMLKRAGDATSERRAFANLVSLYSGAFILADGQQSRSGVIGEVQVIARANWDGPDTPHPSKRSRAQVESDGTSASDRSRGHMPSPPPTCYDSRHEHVDVTRLVVTHPGSHGEEIDSGLKPGDYDGRIFSLRRVDTLVDRGDGRLVVALETHDACYTVSERVPGYRCKHLESDLHVPTAPDVTRIAETPMFHGDDVHASFVRGPESTQVVLLNTILGVLAHDDEGVSLLLARRTNRANNAHDVLSATSGGVFENRRAVGVNDADELGTPSPLASTLREAREELGMEFSPDDVAAQAVFLANVQGRPGASGNRDNGQLVSTVCYLTEVDASLTDVERSRALHANWEAGRYEASELDALRFPKPNGRTERERGRAAEAFMREIQKRAAELDQNAVICALYAAAHQYGVDVVMDAMREGLRQPWWQTPWGGDAERRPRVARHPLALYGALSADILASCERWATATRTSVKPHAEVGTVVE